MADVGGDPHVVERREVLEELGVLEGARKPRTHDRVGALPHERGAVERDAALIGAVEAGDQVEERALPRPVGTDDRLDGALMDVERDGVHGRKAAEAPCEPAYGEEAHERTSPAPRRRMRLRSPPIPAGAKITTAIIARP